MTPSIFSQVSSPTNVGSGSTMVAQQPLFAQQLLAIGFSAIPIFAFQGGIVDQLLKARHEQAWALTIPNNSGSAQTVSVADDVDFELLSELARVFGDLSRNQVDLEAGAKSVLYANLWELYR